MIFASRNFYHLYTLPKEMWAKESKYLEILRTNLFILRSYLSLYVNTFKLYSAFSLMTLWICFFPSFSNVLWLSHEYSSSDTCGIQISTHSEGHYRELSVDTNMFRPKNMCQMLHWLEKDILTLKLYIFIFNWINIVTHPPRAQYIKHCRYENE